MFNIRRWLNRFKQKITYRNIQLRFIETSDAEILMRLRNDNYRWFYSNRKFTLQEVESWIENLSDSDRVYMAEYKGHIIGTCSVYNFKDFDFKNDEAEVGRIVVDKKYTGRGAGTAILTALIKMIPPRVVLYASIKKNNKSSQRIFEKCGFKKIKETSFGYLFVLERSSHEHARS